MSDAPTIIPMQQPAGTMAPARMSDLGNASFDPSSLQQLPPPDQLLQQAKPGAQQPPAPAQQPEPSISEQYQQLGEGQQEEQPAQPEGDQPPAEESTEGQLTPEQQAAKYAELMASPDLDLEAFGDKTIWTKDRNGNPVPIRARDLDKHVMLYGDYQHKTTELARERRAFEGQQAGMQAFQRDLLSGDPQLALKAMRWIGAEKSMHSMVVAYVQRMAQLEGLPPEVRQQFIEGERARDRAEALERQLQAREQQARAEAEAQAAQQGIEAPDIQHVMGHIQTRLPALMKEAGVVESPAFDRLLGEQLVRATEGERGPDGRWLTAPVIQRGRTPTDDVLRGLVGAAREELQRLIASSGARQPPRSQQLPPPPAAAATSGPAARPGQRGNISQPQRMRFSDMENRRGGS